MVSLLVNPAFGMFRIIISLSIGNLYFYEVGVECTTTIEVGQAV